MFKRKFLSTVIILTLLVCLQAAATFVARAAEDDYPFVATDLLNPAKDGYFYLDDPSALTVADDGKVVVALASGKALAFGETVTEITLGKAVDGFFVLPAEIVTLSGGRLETAGGELSDGVIDVSYYGGKLYALTQNSVRIFGTEMGKTVLPFEREIPLSFSGKKIAADGENVYVSAAASQYSPLDDLYRISAGSGETVRIVRRIPAVADICAGKKALFVLSFGGLSKYELRSGGVILSESFSESGIMQIAAGSEKLYALTELGAVKEFDFSLGGFKSVFASASGELGFFHSPTNVSSRKRSVLVCDTDNDRVVKISDGKATKTDFDFLRPVAAVTDNTGAVAVAHDLDKIVVFDSLGEVTKNFVLKDEIITDLSYDVDNALYALCAGGNVYGIGEESVKVGSGFKAFTAALGRKALYGIKENTVFDVRKNEALFSVPETAVALAADNANAFYVLTSDGRLTKYDKGIAGNYAAAEGVTLCALSESAEDALGGAVKIAVSAIKNGDIDYGDIIICDEQRHSVRRLPASVLNVTVLYGDFTPPAESDLPLPSTENGEDRRIIRTALIALDIYEKPVEMSPKFTAAKGRKIIVADYDIESAFARVLVDDVLSETLISGYAYRAQLSDALPYDKPIAGIVTVYNDATKIYRYPSRKASVLSGFKSVKKNAVFKALSFVKDFSDDYPVPVRWYRVDVGGGNEGYVQAIDVSVKHYDPVFERPQTNAVVISVDGSTGAPLYFYDEGAAKYEMADDQPLSTGTKVEVVDTFDHSRPYTKVRYFDENYGTLEGWVETVYLKYDGLGMLPVIIAALVFLAGVGMIVTFLWNGKARERKITKA